MLFPKTLLPLFTALCVSAAPADDGLGDLIAPRQPKNTPTPSAASITQAPSDGPSNAGPAPGSGSTDDAACSGWYDWYGNGRWTYVEVQFCFTQSTSGTTAVVSLRNGQYYWGGAWYNAKSYDIDWDIKGSLVGVEDFSGSGKTVSGAGRTEYYSFTQKVNPGTYTVTLHYHQVGPYWSGDAAIDQDTSFPIVLGN